MSDPNVFDCTFAYEGDEPAGYVAGEAPVGKQAGGAALNVRLYEAAPGQSVCPYHYEYEEEWLLVLQGEVTLRTPEGERRLAQGALVCFAPGPDGAHKVTAQGETAARVMMFSGAREPAVAVYPDSDKIGVWPPNREDAIMVRRADANIDYWDGER